MTSLPPSGHTDPAAGDSIGDTGSDMATPDGRATPAVRDNARENRSSNQTMYDTHRGALITVTAHRNPRGAWLADVSITCEGRPMNIPADLANVQPVTPEWLTESEALRAGIEHGRYLIDRTLRDTSSPLSAPQWRLDEER